MERYFEKEKNIESKAFIKILTNNKSLGSVKPATTWQCWRKGKVSGRLIGGNLGVLSPLIRSSYFPSNKIMNGAVLFWEVDNVDYFMLEKWLYQLKYAGILDQIGGMIIGKLVDLKKMTWEGMKYPTPKKLVLDLLKDYKFPILANVDFGHKSINLPMPIGIKVKLDATNKKFSFMESAVK